MYYFCGYTWQMRMALVPESSRCWGITVLMLMFLMAAYPTVVRDAPPTDWTSFPGWRKVKCPQKVSGHSWNRAFRECLTHRWLLMKAVIRTWWVKAGLFQCICARDFFRCSSRIGIESLYIYLCNCLILICSIQHQMKVKLWTTNNCRLRLRSAKHRNRR